MFLDLDVKAEKVLRLGHTKPEEFEIWGFTLKTHHMFSIHTTPEEFENVWVKGG